METLIETRVCKKCSVQFPITDRDVQFYDSVSPVIAGNKFSIPLPTLCPICRSQRRWNWRNERNLYWRKCDKTGKDILSVFSPDKPYTVYSEEAWYQDDWDPLSYGRDFDFSRGFFEQFNDLLKVVPQNARSVVGNTNCEYINQAGWCKNCYLVFEVTSNEDCAYANYLNRCKNCLDQLQVRDSELCYECVNCKNCYDLRFSQDCDNCSESWFLKACIGCKNCFGCVNLRNKQYHIFNQAYSKEDYYKKLQEYNLESRATILNIFNQFVTYSQQFPAKYIHGIQNENSTGDYLNNTQNCSYCFDALNVQDSKYLFNVFNAKESYDVTVFGGEKGFEFCYECHEIGDGSRNLLFTDQSWGGLYNIMYSKLCINNCHDLFGCIGLKHKEYCILNKQYTKEEYEKLVPRIVEHMGGTLIVDRLSNQGNESNDMNDKRQTINASEWGEYFPANMSPFGYNETIAQEHYQLDKDRAISQGFKWFDEVKKDYQKTDFQVPDLSSQIPEDVLTRLFTCTSCEKNFKVVKMEIDFYKKMKLPLPVKCHNCRHYDRMKLRNPWKLNSRNCSKCQMSLQSSYPADTKNPVYCEKCYLEITE